MNEIITVRDLAMVTSDIQYAQRQGARQLASNLIEIGRLLTEAREMVKPADWPQYIWDNFGYSTSSADNWMKLYREYGNDQESLFDSFTNSQTFGKLSYTQLLALTALPAEERGEFVEHNDVENMSTRQLQQAIRERDEARSQAASAQLSMDTMQSQLDKARRDQEDARKEAEAAIAKKKLAEEKARAQADQAKKDLEKAQAAEKKAREELKKLKSSPVPEDVMEKLRAEARAEGAAREAERFGKLMEAAKKEAEAAIQARRESEEKLQSFQKASTMQNPDVAVFKSLLQQVRDDFGKLLSSRRKIGQADPATGENLQQVIIQLLDKLSEEARA